MTISKRLRFEILRRDGHRCRYCGRASTETQLTIDHVTPVSLGGTDDPTNLVAACDACNLGKTSVPASAPLVADVAADALRWSRALAEAAAQRSMQRALIDRIITEVNAEWNGWTFKPYAGARSKRAPRPSDWPDSVERFVVLGLDGDTLTRFVGVAMRRTQVDPNDLWTYFCGCCWTEIEKLQGLARQILDEERSE